MISKKLAIAAAIALLTGLGAGQAFAQSSDQPPAPAMASPSGAPATGDQSTAPAPAAAAPAPAPAVAAPPPAAPTEEANPYGLGSLWNKGDFVARGVIVLLAIMSVGTWYISLMKYWEQSRVLGQAAAV
ncbi:MAG TPA: hypothetical protein VHX39_25225 [Acetobacteraceae bacterium]|nr:hypothetical protein [Acetobacteraceae bacterium]